MDRGSPDVPPEGPDRDSFMMHVLKVVPCTKAYVHDWSSCPFAHDGEKARRRDPSLYTAVACPNMKQEGSCEMGLICPFAHNDFEYWGSPQRYRTAMCSKGVSCTRTFCFFAHHPSQLRVPAERPRAPSAAAMEAAQRQAASLRAAGGAPGLAAAQLGGGSTAAEEGERGAGFAPPPTPVVGGGAAPPAPLIMSGAGSATAALAGSSAQWPAANAQATPLGIFQQGGNSDPAMHTVHQPSATPSIGYGGLSLPMAAQSSMHSVAAAGVWDPGFTAAQALVQGVSDELAAGRMDPATAVSILERVLHPPPS